MDFLSYISVGQIPSPSSSVANGGQTLFDVKDYVTAIAATLTASVVVAVFAIFKRAKIGRFFNAAKLFIVDKWTRLRTPVETIHHLKVRLAAAIADQAEWQSVATSLREAGKDRSRELEDAQSELRALSTSGKQLEDLSEEEFNQWCEAKGYKLSKPVKPKLPPRWAFSMKWDEWQIEPGLFTLTNRGPGTAHHVMLDHISNVAVPTGDTYWEVIEPQESHICKIPNGGIQAWSGEPTLKLSWRDEDGREQSTQVRLSKPPSVLEAEKEPPF